MALRYPAIFIGGPPGSGKSWLIMNLSKVLRERGVKHYMLRAHPDGEGNWRYEAPPPVAEGMRRLVKGDWTPAFAAAISQDVERRHLPLLVDTGGKASAETRLILSHCTAAVLLGREYEQLEPWRALVAEQAIPLLAELRSVRDEAPAVDDAGATLRGSIDGLGPELTPSGECFTLLVERLDALCRLDPAVLRRRHRALTELELIDLEGPIGALPAHTPSGRRWALDELPTLLAGLAPGAPLALYGVGPTWLYGALAVHSSPAPLELFQAALAWVTPPPLAIGGAPDPARLRVEQHAHGSDVTRIQLTIIGNYLDYAGCLATPLAVPAAPPETAVVLDGKLPLWLYAALCRAYAGAPWLAIREPRGAQLQAVVIASRSAAHPVGAMVQLPEA